MPTILLIEDDAAVSHVIEEHLVEAGGLPTTVL
jgi:hypothetical protein